MLAIGLYSFKGLVYSIPSSTYQLTRLIRKSPTLRALPQSLIHNTETRSLDIVKGDRRVAIKSLFSLYCLGCVRSGNWVLTSASLHRLGICFTFLPPIWLAECSPNRAVTPPLTLRIIPEVNIDLFISEKLFGSHFPLFSTHKLVSIFCNHQPPLRIPLQPQLPPKQAP